jgi:hypothetical protein
VLHGQSHGGDSGGYGLHTVVVVEVVDIHDSKIDSFIEQQKRTLRVILVNKFDFSKQN